MSNYCNARVIEMDRNTWDPVLNHQPLSNYDFRGVCKEESILPYLLIVFYFYTIKLTVIATIGFQGCSISTEVGVGVIGDGNWLKAYLNYCSKTSLLMVLGAIQVSHIGVLVASVAAAIID